MRNIVIKKTLYTFNELSEEAKNQAIETRRQDIVEDDNTYYFQDVIANMLDNWNDLTGITVNVDDVCYSLSYCQGDGVSFVSRYIDIEKVLDFYSKQGTKQAKASEKIRKDTNYQYVKDSFEFTIRRIDSMYTHENTVGCYYTDTTYEYTDGQWELAEQIAQIINEVKNYVCRDIYNELDEAYNYLLSDEYIKELLEMENNEYTADGIEWYN